MSDITDKLDERRVLVVDDSETNRILFCDMFDILGHGSDTAADGVQGLDLYKQRQYRLIITDLQMPRMDGIQLMRGILSNGNGVPVLLSTTMSYEIQDIWKKEGFAGILPKPFSFDQFRQSVQPYLL